MRIVFASLPAFGHLYPMMPLALACADAGHDVVVAAGQPFLDRLPIPTVAGVPAGFDLQSSIQETMRRHPGTAGRELALTLFADTTAEFVSETLLTVFERARPDLVVYEPLNVGAGVAADLLEIPAAAFAIGVTHSHIGTLHAETLGHHRHRWVRLGRQPPPETSLLAKALLDPIPPSLQEPGDTTGVARIPIRPVAFSETIGAVPDWLTGPRARPRVYVTLGTVSFGAVEVLRRAVAEIASLDVDVLVAVGPQRDPATLGEVAGNVRVERFVAQSEVLPLVDLVVHHGGTGTVLGALAVGLPQLILPQGADQFHNARALTAIGAARALRNDEQSPGSIRDGVSALLTDDRERAVTIRLCDEIAALPAPADVVAELVELVDR